MPLPQEIIDLIVDQVSAHGRASKLMKTCSLVSHSFHARARTCLFSHVYLCTGTYRYQRKKSRKFLRILKYKKNSDLISHIRYLEIFVYRLLPQSDFQQQYSVKRLLKLIGIDRSPVKAVLAMLKNAPIEQLILRGVSEYDFQNHRISTLLLELCSNPNIKTLRINGLNNIPYGFIAGNGQDRSLTQLALYHVTISDYWFDTWTPSIAEAIDTLELVRMTSKEFLKALRCLSWLPSTPISECFKNLKNLVITFPQQSFEERKEVWNVIFGLAGTLESLELRLCTMPPDAGEVSLYFVENEYEHEYADNPSEPDYYDVRPLRLDCLNSLQRLKIISADLNRPRSEFVDELTLMQMILASPTAPVHIRSIILETSVLGHSKYEGPSILAWEKWLLIDAILASPIFVDLCTVEVTVTDYPYACIEVPRMEPTCWEHDFAALLPTIYCRSRISLMTSNRYAYKVAAIYEMYPVDHDM